MFFQTMNYMNYIKTRSFFVLVRSLATMNPQFLTFAVIPDSCREKVFVSVTDFFSFCFIVVLEFFRSPNTFQHKTQRTRVNTNLFDRSKPSRQKC